LRKPQEAAAMEMGRKRDNINMTETLNERLGAKGRILQGEENGGMTGIT
jgi:hypothetical protein